VAGQVRAQEFSVENLGPTINTAYGERFSMISPDGLVLYFASDRPDGQGQLSEQGRKPWDMYVAWRASVGEPFGEAVNLGPTVNSSYGDHSSAFSEDGHWMYFASARPGGCGGYDLYISYREDTGDHLGWQPAEHLGCTVNTRFDEACPFFITDEQTGDPLVYLVRETVPADGPNYDIYISEVGDDMRELRSASLVSELSSPAHDGHFEPRHGFIWSARDGGYGGSDVWVTDSLQRNQWSEARNMGPAINTEYAETLPSGTTDGQLFFPSNRPGGYGDFDVYVATPSGP
jgi:hypothetical protein